MKKLLLATIAVAGALTASAADNVADFDTFNNGKAASGYGTYTTTAGWSATNSCIVKVGENLAPTLNGKTSAVGTLTSPVLENGLGHLSFDYTNTFSETKGVSVEVSILVKEGEEFTVAQTETLTNTDVTQGTTYSFTSKDFNVSGEFKIQIKNLSPSAATKNKDRVSIWNLQWTNYGAAATVAAPVIEMVQGSYGFQVTMSCETEGATIYYTSDGTEPTTASTAYTNPIDVWFDTTFKALAVKGDDQSRVVTFEANPPMVLDDFSPLVGADESFKGSKILVTNPLTVVAQRGNNLILKCGYSNALVYGNLNRTFNPGDRISSLGATLDFYNGMLELINPDFGEVTAGTPVEPTEGTLEDITNMNLFGYYSIADLTIEATGNNNYTLTDAEGNTAVMHNNFYNTKYPESYLEIPEGAGYTVIGYVGKNNTTIQLIPMEAPTGGVVEVKAETPVFTPDGGFLEKGAFITITSATEGASIYYTLDSTEPTTESTLYTAPIEFTGEAMTISAIAVAEGFLPSDVATKMFELKSENPSTQGTATFNFNDPTTLTPAYEAVSDTEINGTNFTAKEVITMTFADGSQSARLWSCGTHGMEVRAYNGATITVAAAEGNVINSVQFEGASLTNITEGSTALNEGVWEANGSEAVKNVVFSVGPKRADITKVTVNYTTISGVADIEFDENAPVEFYNLQGVRMNGELTPGLYIRRQGSKAAKILVK